MNVNVSARQYIKQLNKLYERMHTMTHFVRYKHIGPLPLDVVPTLLKLGRVGQGDDSISFAELGAKPGHYCEIQLRLFDFELSNHSIRIFERDDPSNEIIFLKIQ